MELVPGARTVSDIVLEIAVNADNPNYFSTDYQQPGDRYHRPNITQSAHLRSWRVAAAGAAELDAEVYNLSEGSSVDAFDFCSLDDLLGGRDASVRSASSVLRSRGRQE